MTAIRQTINRAVDVLNAMRQTAAGQRFAPTVQPKPCRRCSKPTLVDTRGPEVDERSGLCPGCYKEELEWIREHNR